MSPIEILLTEAMVICVFAVFGRLIGKITGKSVSFECSILAVVTILFIAMIDLHKTEKVKPTSTKRNFNCEYKLELINDSTVKVLAVDGSYVYICKPNQIGSVLITDNL